MRNVNGCQSAFKAPVRFDESKLKAIIQLVAYVTFLSSHILIYTFVHFC